MATTIAIVVAAVFGVLSLVHVYWVLGGRTGKVAAVPQVSSRPAFVPSTLATFVVAVGLAACALLLAAAAHVVVSPFSGTWLKWLCLAWHWVYWRVQWVIFAWSASSSEFGAARLRGWTLSCTPRYACRFRLQSSTYRMAPDSPVNVDEPVHLFDSALRQPRRRIGYLDSLTGLTQ